MTIEGGITTLTAGMGNAAYFAMFGGNKDDTGQPGDPKNWWGNIDEPNPSRQYHSETQRILDGLPATSGNLVVLQEAVNRDLAFFLTDGIASSVEAVVRITAPKRVAIVVDIEANGERSQFTFTENWEARQ